MQAPKLISSDVYHKAPRHAERLKTQNPDAIACKGPEALLNVV
jgi:hypothetical protein